MRKRKETTVEHMKNKLDITLNLLQRENKLNEERELEIEILQRKLQTSREAFK